MDETGHDTGGLEPSTSWLVNGGEMGERIRAKDWSETPLGPIESWPPCLRTVVSLCVASPFPILIAWGPQRVMLFNDGCRALSGGPPPHLLGQPLGQYWGAAWAELRGHYDQAFASQPVILENQPLFRDRGGRLEETFFSGAFSPIRDERGEVVGVWNPLTETTRQVLHERRTRALRDVAMAVANAQTLPDVFTLAARALETHERDLPFTLFYVRDTRGSAPRLVGSTGLPPGTAASPTLLFSPLDTARGWPLEEVMRARRPVQVGHLEERFGPLRCGPYPESPREAVAIPISLPGEEEPTALLLAGVSARLELDEPYREFHRLLASAVTAAALQSHDRADWVRSRRRRNSARPSWRRSSRASPTVSASPTPPATSAPIGSIRRSWARAASRTRSSEPCAESRPPARCTGAEWQREAAGHPLGHRARPAAREHRRRGEHQRGHHRAQARRGGTGGPAGQRAGGPERSGAGQPEEGRVPRAGLA
ncbi:hypothetical protein ACN28S_40155 [Cystobacter fuscus]